MSLNQDNNNNKSCEVSLVKYLGLHVGFILSSLFLGLGGLYVCVCVLVI